MADTNINFSIIIPTLNEEKFLPRLLDDLHRQTYSHFEVIIVDGNSQDATVVIAEKFKSILPHLTILITSKGVSLQRNRGAQKANQPWLLFIDADVRLDPTCLENINQSLSNYPCDSFTVTMKSDPDTLHYRLATDFITTYMKKHQSSPKPYVVEAFFGINKDLFDNLKGFNQQLSCEEGSDLLLRAKKVNATFTVFLKPYYYFSMRRAIKQGFLKSLISNAQIELNRLGVLKISNQRKHKLYPMEGGKVYE
jgi:glycosyltransferase involved in cell wall biosynthesis